MTLVYIREPDLRLRLLIISWFSMYFECLRKFGTIWWLERKYILLLVHFMRSYHQASYCVIKHSLQWCHNGRSGVSNHQPHDCLLNRLFRRRSKKISKPHVTGLRAGNSQVTGEFPAQRASNAENCFRLMPLVRLILVTFCHTVRICIFLLNQIPLANTIHRKQ